MKQVGVVYGYKSSRWIGHKTDELISLLNSSLNRHDCVAEKVGIMDVKIKIKNNKLIIRDALTNDDLKNLSALYVANWRVNPEIAMGIVTYLKRHGVPVINPEIGGFLPLTKLGEFILLSDAGVPLPDSVFMRHKHIHKALKRGKMPFQYPFIAKSTNGSMGSSNWLIKNEADMYSAMVEDPESLFVLQEFIPNTFDYRVLIFGGKPKLVIKRSRKNDDTHLNNTSKGGDGLLVPLEKIDQSLLDLAEKAAKLVGRSNLAGVDIVINSLTGKPYILEVNKSPQIETGSNVQAKLDVFSDYIMESING